MENTMICPHCNQEHPAGAAFCPNTGQAISLSAACTRCGSPLEADWNTCPDCGLKIGAAPAAGPPAAVQPARPRNRRLVAVGSILAGVLVLLVACLGLLAVLLLIDPFDLHLIGRFNGRYDAAADSMPTQTDLYLGVNLLNAYRLDQDKLAPLGITLALVGQTAGIIPEELLESSAGEITNPSEYLNETLEEGFGVTFPNDFTPWIGQYAGIGISGMEYALEGEKEPGLLIAFEARSTRNADSFLEKIAGHLSAENDMEFSELDYSGAHILYIDDEPAIEQLALGRSGRMVLLGLGVDTLKDAVRAQQGNSMAETEEYRAMAARLPRGSFARIYIDSGWLQTILSVAEQGLDLTGAATRLPFSQPAWEGSLIGISSQGDELRLDILTNLSGSELFGRAGERLEAMSTKHNSLERIPQNALFYITGERLDLTWEEMEESLSGQFMDIGDLTSLVVGFDLGDDLLGYLDGEWLFYALPPKEVGQEPDPDVVFLAQTSEPDQLAASLESAVDQMGLFLQVESEPAPWEDGDIFVVQESFSQTPLFSFGLDDTYLLISGEAELLEAAGSREGLVSARHYRNATGHLPRGQQPLFYLDVQPFLELIQIGLDGEAAETFEANEEFIKSLLYVIAGNSAIDEDLTQTTVVFIYSPE
jgi:hypothetical protein